MRAFLPCLSLKLLRILKSNHANIPYAELSYNVVFKAQRGKIGKNYTYSLSHVIELSILLHRDVITDNAILFICEN